MLLGAILIKIPMVEYVLEVRNTEKFNEIFCQKFVIFSEFKQGIDTLNETPVLEQKQSKPLLYQIFCCYKYKS